MNPPSQNTPSAPDPVAAANVELRERVAKLERERDKWNLAQARADSVRLDWLDKHTFTNRENEREIHFDFLGDFRAAIDAALAATPEQEKEGE